MSNDMCPNTKKLGMILALTLFYFFAELVIGSWIRALSLVADSFHMLSDVISIIIGIIAIRVSKMPKSGANTFGWQRAEVFGSLVNCISLLTLCFTIFVSAIQRLFIPEKISDPMLMLLVSSGGLLINFIGLVLLNPTHSHSAPSAESVARLSSHVQIVENEGRPILVVTESEESNEEVKLYSAMKRNSLLDDIELPHHHHEDNSMNIRAIFLHIIADFIGSTIVCCSALVLLYGPGNDDSDYGVYKLYVDPILSFCMLGIIVIPTFSLVKQASLILLQSVPEEINIKSLIDEIHEVENVKSIHDLHIWRLRPNVIIGSAHVKVISINDYKMTSTKIKQLFHNYDIHCTTLQPEFISVQNNTYTKQDLTDDTCEMLCDSKYNCSTSTCCPLIESK